MDSQPPWVGPVQHPEGSGEPTDSVPEGSSYRLSSTSGVADDEQSGRHAAANVPTRVLLVEDNPGDARLVHEALVEAGSTHFELTHVERLDRALSLLSGRDFDLVLLDLSLPDGEGLSNVTRLRDAVPDLPIVVLTGRVDDAFALSTVRHGAQDYLVKSELTAEHLVRSIQYSLERTNLLVRERQARARLEIALGSAETALAMREQFLSAASHELMTPITALKGFTHLARRSLESAITPANHDDYMARIAVQTDRLTRLVRDLLDGARLSTGKLDLNLEPTPLAVVVDNVLNVLHEIDPKRPLRVRRAESEPVIVVDAGRIEQVLIHLLDNARKYSPADRPIGLSTQVDSDYVRIAVQDEGMGVPLEDQERIFDRFQRAANVYRGVSGLGLGLSIARAIVELHNGRIVLDSEVGIGSTVTVILPRIAESARLSP